MTKIDLKWRVAPKNQLWLRWKKIERAGDGKIKLINAEFYGDVLLDCEQIQETGYINIDLTKHFIVIIPEPYIIKLSWNKLLLQNKEIAKFDEMIIEDHRLGHLDNKLTDKDSILLDASGHTTEAEARGKYKYSFEGMIYNSNKTPYDFSV